MTWTRSSLIVAVWVVAVLAGWCKGEQGPAGPEGAIGEGRRLYFSR